MIDPTLFPSEEDRYAGFISRAIAFVLDILVVLIINALINFTIRVLIGFFGLLDSEIVGDFSAGRLADGLAVILPAILQAVYFIGCWSTFGRTPGMSLLGIRVEETNRPGDVTVVRAILRYIGLYVSLIPLGLGFFWVFIDKKRQGWMDKMGNTYVVYSSTAMRYHKKRQAAQKNIQTTEKIAARAR